MSDFDVNHKMGNLSLVGCPPASVICSGKEKQQQQRGQLFRFYLALLLCWFGHIFLFYL